MFLSIVMAGLSVGCSSPPDAPKTLDDLASYKKYMGITIGLSVLFLCVKAYEYVDKFSHGDFPSKSTFFAIYFTLTGLHALHIIAGVIVNGYFLGPGSALWKVNR